MTDGYLSRDREHLAELQRKRRERVTRIDYMPSDQALLAVGRVRDCNPRLQTNSALIDAIILEWANLTGIKYGEIEGPMSLAKAPLRVAAMTSAPHTSTKLSRVRCGARRHRDGQPCRGLSEPGKRRCKFHGGRSTGPRTPEGKAKVAQNLAAKPEVLP